MTTPIDVYLSVFEPTTLLMTTVLGLAFGAFFWVTMGRVEASRVLVVYIPAIVFMVATGLGRYVDGAPMWPAWFAAGTLWTWAIAVAVFSVRLRRRYGL